MWLIIGVTVLSIGAVLWGVWWVWWKLPKRQLNRLSLKIRDAKARADVEDNFRKTIGQLLGGAAVLIGGVAAYLQFVQQQRAAHDLLISNQVSKGFEQLGSDKVTVRLGGIYALEGVMNTSEQYHQPVLEALSAFVRDGTRTETGGGPPATDIQAALTVIGRRTAIGTGNADLANAHIPKADLSGADLRGAKLSGADLRGASLIHANLTGASLIDVNLTGAILSYANLTGASLIRANLSDALMTNVAVSQGQLIYACGTGVVNLFGLSLTQKCEK